MPVTSALAPSERLGLLSFALSAWVGGSAQLRNVLFLVNTDASSTLSSSIDSNEWLANFLDWLTRHSRELDSGELTAIAGLDLTTALAIFKILQIKPLLPFLLTPILATVPLPKSLNARSLYAVRWFRVGFTILLATLLGESNKVTVLHMLRLWRRQQTIRRKLTMGKVVARGAPLGPPTEDEESEEEIECLICSGVGTDEVDPMAQSISSLSSATFESNNRSDQHHQVSTNSDSFGPLEEFCTTAPRKHALHRDCGLRWVETYRQQHLRVFLEPVHVQFDGPEETASRPQMLDRKEKSRISSFLQAAGFDHMSQSLIFPTQPRDTLAGATLTTASETVTSPVSRRRATSQLRSSTLTVAHSTEAPPSSGTVLGALRTCSPSCPACRGPVNILFTQEPITSHPRMSSSSPLTAGLTPAQRYLRTAKLIRWFLRGWWKECLASVTGRSLLVRLAAQYTFLLVLVSMIKASGRSRQRA